MTRVQRLLRLRSKIIDKVFKERWEDVWFFPHYEGVRGYLGVQNIIFLSINPSLGVFPSWVDREYYRTLRKQGFSNAHLTDVFKQRARDWKYLSNDRKLKNEAKEFLLEEIKIIQPKLIVLVGKSYREFYEEVLGDIDIERITIQHYAMRYGTKRKLRASIRKEIKRIKAKYDSIR